MTTRMQITLEPKKHRRVRRRAIEQGISLAESIRRLVDEDLDGAAGPRPDISDIFGIGHSCGSDIARSTDRYLAEALEADHRKTTHKR